MSIDPTDATCVPLATGSSRSDKIRAVAQQAHDNGDCVCCLPDEMVEFERAKQTTITTINLPAGWKIENGAIAALEGER